MENKGKESRNKDVDKKGRAKKKYNYYNRNKKRGIKKSDLSKQLIRLKEHFDTNYRTGDGLATNKKEGYKEEESKR